MKRIFLLFLLTMVLAGCGKGQTAAPIHTTAPTIPTTEPTTLPTEPTQEETEPTKPEHSPFYIEGLSALDVITYFNEVCLATEYATGSGDPSLVQKWDEPIYYTVHGDATPEDLTVIEEFFTWLNTVEGFPGARQATDAHSANLNIHFTDEAGMAEQLGDSYVDMDGAVLYWYTDNCIYSEDICILTRLEQPVRNSVILEELYNGTGLCQDTVMREDSIIYQYSSTNQVLSPIDKILLQLAYNPAIRPGMNAVECAAVIQHLYY